MIRNIQKGYLLFAFCLLTVNTCLSQSVSSPDVKCLAVLPNGDVTLTWTIPASGSFVSYHIDTSSFATGPFATYTTIPSYPATSCTHFGAGANTKRKYYLVYTESSTAPLLSAPKDTFSTIFLTVTNPGNGTAILVWNKISIQPISTSTGWYKIYREYPAGTWSLRDSTQTLQYIDEIDICSSVLNYRIEIDDNTECTSVSNIAGGSVFSDITPPDLAVIDTVSVEATSSLATISWIPSPSLDADSIVIYKSAGGALGPWNPIDTVPVPITSYTYTASNAATVSELFRLAVLDSCGNISPLGIYHKTVFLSVTFNICAATADLVWNKYVNWTPAVSQYEIWKSVNGGIFTLIGSNPNSDTTFLDTGLQLGDQYCYFIRATNGSKTSSSNRVCFSPGVSQPPAYTYARYATVTGDNSILVKAHVDFSSSVKYYRIQRATAGGSFVVILPATLPTAGTITHTDLTVNTTSNSYIYKIDAIDSCGNVIESSNFDTTILLSASIAANLDIQLSWNDYGRFDANVDHYNVYRSVDGVWDPIPAGTVAFTGNGGQFTDDIAPYLTSKGHFEYYVVAVEGTGNTYGFTDSSASNVVRVDHYPKFYVPNAFTPNEDGKNDVFIPVIGFIEPTDYSLMIFDRTGTPVFESLSPLEGWNGTKKGHPCQAGVYMYLIKCKASNGDDSKISGTVSLFR